MSDPTKAVFLSYASQDAEAAKRIAEALRAASVEVWFDVEGGLETGDEWDQKIRRQIKECVLFIAVISQNTQARHEGYFRIEWELAAQRAMGFASGVAFILPVVIDDTREPEALVPDRFRAVQWTRLPGGVMAPEVVARFVKLWSHRAGVVKADRAIEVGRVSAPPMSQEGTRAGQRPALPRRRGLSGGVVVLFAAALAVGGYFWLRRPAEPATNAGAGTRPPTAATAVWPRDPELKRAMALVNGLEANPEDFTLAEDIAKKVLDKNSTAPEAVTVMARVQVAFLFRGFDLSDERFAAARRYAERAVQLGPEDPEAVAALGICFLMRAADYPRARELLERAVALRPGEPLFHRFRDRAIFGDLKVPTAEALAASEKTAALFPGDALAHYELSRHYRDAGRIADMERELDRTLAITPLTNAIVWKARIALLVRADAAEMKALLDQVPSRTRSGERVVFSRWIHGMVTGQAEDGLTALGSLTTKWIDDFEYTGPTALLTAQLLELQGKPAMARAQHAVALAEAQTRKARNPADYYARVAEVWALHGLKRDAEARALHPATLEGLRRPYRYGLMGDWWFNAIPASLLLSERATALDLIREAVTASAEGVVSRRVMLSDGDVARRLAGAVGGESYAAEARAALRLRFKQDPRMAPWRDDPEIVALLAEPADGADKKTVAAPPALSSPSGLSEGAQLAARALALFAKTSFTRDDLGPAEDFARRATDKEPDNAGAWGVRAGVQAAWIYRNWDVSEKRRQETQTLANRALALDPNEPEALLSLSHVLRKQGALDQAEVHLRRSIAANPHHVRLVRALGFTLISAGRAAEARAVLQELAQRFPREPMVRYELSMSYANYGAGGANPEDLAAALEQLDTAIALQPFASALLAKAALLGGWRGDLSAMRSTLDQLDKFPLGERSEDRAVCLAMWAGLLERRPDRVAATATLTARTYFEDGILPLRPKAWSLALAYRIAGKENLARREWQAAETVLRQRLKDEPANETYQVELAITLAWLEQREEATRLIGAVEPMWREELVRGRPLLLARYYAAAGDAVKTAAYLSLAIDHTVFFARKAIALDPWWDNVRGAPEFAAALKAPAAK
ncbi:MAG: TIR domain-containing protein [Opitutaceae bacterium]|nr:TIR domain-containing protein [Opitutaceae bacterium]